MKFKYLLFALTLGSLAYAEQGHIDMRGATNNTLKTELSYGKVLEVISVPGFKYLKVEKDSNIVWVGIMDVPVPVEVSEGDKVEYDRATVMKNYKSKLLKREFKEIIFASKVKVSSSTEKQTAQKAKSTTEKVSKTFTKKDAYTIEELYTFSENLNGQVVTVKGKVTKVSKGIMSKDWVHLSDGTGSESEKTNDLTLTTKSADMPIGTSVVAKGKLVKDKDFGSGYFYKVILEEVNFLN